MNSPDWWFLLFHSYFPYGSKRSYISLFGISPKVTYLLWTLLQNPPFEPQHLFWALSFLSRYESEDVLYLSWNVSKTTYVNYIWKVLFYLYAHIDEWSLVKYILKILNYRLMKTLVFHKLFQLEYSQMLQQS